MSSATAATTFVGVIFLAIVALNGQTPPTTGLYFMLNNAIYLAGDSVLISDVGPEGGYEGGYRAPGSSLICVTTNVNTDCCRSSDNTNNHTNGGAVGEWFFPNDTMVPRFRHASSFARRGFTEHVRLTRPTKNPAGPPGVYRCEVPSAVNGSNISSNITLVSNSPTTYISPTMTYMPSTSPPTTNSPTTYISPTMTYMPSTSPPTTIAPLTGAPSNIISTPQTMSVRLTWSQSSLDVVDRYIISYRRTAGCNTPSGSRTISGLLRTYTMTGLEEDITYELTITAMNSRNSMSATTSATTLAAAPDGRVSNLQSSEVNYTSITVMWQPEACLQRNGLLIYYSVRYTESSVTSGPFNSSTLSFTATSLFPGTSYTFEIAAVNSEGAGPYTQVVVSTVIPTDVGLLKGILYSNNSVITISEIGQDSEGLFCITDATNCCRGRDASVGIRDWFFPNNSIVGSKYYNQPFSRNRGPGSVILHRDNTLEPSGIYSCKIYNINVYFGIYPQNTGSPTVSSLTYNTTSGVVTCISTGGPVTTVSWSRTGSSYQQSKIVVDTVTATYLNLLSINSSQISNYTGTFTCIVSNSRGNSSMTTGEYKSIGVTGIENIYTVGASVSIICFSNFTVLSIQWLSSSSNIIYTTSIVGSQEILLRVADVSRNVGGYMFTCVVTNLLPAGIVTQRMTITFNTEEIKSSPVLNFKISSSGDNNLTISWSSPDMPNGIITSYFVSIVDLNNNIYITNTSTIDETQMNFTVINLEAGIPYNVSVAALNSKGVGELTSKITFTRELVPNISPQNVVGVRTLETSMTILWNKLALVEARGYILNYTIVYYPLQSTTQLNSIILNKVVNSEFSSTTINGLDANSAYIVHISANTDAGSGLLSTPIIIQLYALTQMTTISVQSNTGLINSVMVSVAAIVIILVLVMIIVLLTIKRQRKSRFTGSDSKEKSSSRDEFREYEKINLKSTEQTLVTTQPTTTGKEIDMTSCPAYGEVKNISAYQNKQVQLEELPGVYETIQ